MAFGLQVPAIRLYLVDGSGSYSQAEYWIRPGSTVEDGRGAAHTMRGALAGLTLCTIYGFAVEYRGVELTAPVAAGPAAAARTGVLIFTTTAPDEYAIVTIPGVRDDLVLTTGAGAGVQLDTTSPAISALVAELTNGDYVNPFGYILTGLAGAMLQIRP